MHAKCRKLSSRNVLMCSLPRLEFMHKVVLNNLFTLVYNVYRNGFQRIHKIVSQNKYVNAATNSNLQFISYFNP